jgi:hypothetical protein
VLSLHSIDALALLWEACVVLSTARRSVDAVVVLALGMNGALVTACRTVAKACCLTRRFVGTLRRLLGALATLINRNIVKAWCTAFDGFGAVDARIDARGVAVDAVVRCDGAVDARIDALCLVRRLGGGCRLYDGSEEAVACRTACRRLSLVGRLVGGCRLALLLVRLTARRRPVDAFVASSGGSRRRRRCERGCFDGSEEAC